MKDDFIQKKHDIRFVKLIDGFIRNNICNILKMYDQLESIYKKESRRMIRKEINQSMKPYVSRKTYCKIKLGLI